MLREIFPLGATVFVRQSVKTLLLIIVNNSLKYHAGELAIAAFRAVFRLLAFVVVPIMAVGQGFQPIAGYAFGTWQQVRLREAIFKAAAAATGMAVVAFVLMMALRRTLMALFSSDPQLLQLAVPALRIIVLAPPLIGLHIIIGSMYFFTTGKIVPALILSLSRQVLILIPLVLLFPLMWGAAGIWMAFPAADVLFHRAGFCVDAAGYEPDIPRQPR